MSGKTQRAKRDDMAMMLVHPSGPIPTVSGYAAGMYPSDPRLQEWYGWSKRMIRRHIEQRARRSESRKFLRSAVIPEAIGWTPKRHWEK